MNNITITLIVIFVILLVIILRPHQTKDHSTCKCDFNDVECKTACSLKNTKRKKVKFNNTVDKVKIL